MAKRSKVTLSLLRKQVIVIQSAPLFSGDRYKHSLKISIRDSADHGNPGGEALAFFDVPQIRGGITLESADSSRIPPRIKLAKFN